MRRKVCFRARSTTQVDQAVADRLLSKEMATLAPSSSPSPPPLKRRRKTWARKCERYCCNVVTYLPLAFVYGLSTWAVWVEAGIGFMPTRSSWIGMCSRAMSGHDTDSFPGCRLHIFQHRHTAISSAQLVLYYHRLHRPGFSSAVPERIFSPPNTRTSTQYLLYRQIDRRRSLLQEMPGTETRPRASLLDLQTMRAKDGSPLSLVRDLRRTAELQTILALFGVYHVLLLDLFCGYIHMGLERGFERRAVHRELDARQLRAFGCHLWYYWLGPYGIYGLAF